MAMTSGMYTSDTIECPTPWPFFQQLDQEFHFTLDVCATPFNAKCPVFYSRQEDGLSQIWRGIVWMNPPYGRTIGLWIEKAYRSSREGCIVVCLLPSRTDTAWWHQYCMQGEIRFVRGRLRFLNDAPAPFPSAVVIFGEGYSHSGRVSTIERG